MPADPANKTENKQNQFILLTYQTYLL